MSSFEQRNDHRLIRARRAVLPSDVTGNAETTSDPAEPAEETTSRAEPTTTERQTTPSPAEPSPTKETATTTSKEPTPEPVTTSETTSEQPTTTSKETTPLPTTTETMSSSSSSSVTTSSSSSTSSSSTVSTTSSSTSTSISTTFSSLSRSITVPTTTSSKSTVTAVSTIGGGALASGSPSPSASSAPSTSGAVSAGPIAGGVVGGLLGLAILGMIIAFFVRRNRRKARLENWNASQFRNSAMILDDDQDHFQPPAAPSMAQRNVYANSFYDTGSNNLAGAGAFRNAPPSDPYMGGGYQDAVRQPAQAAQASYPFGNSGGNAGGYDPTRPSVDGAAMVAQTHAAYSLPSPYDEPQNRAMYSPPPQAYAPEFQRQPSGAHPYAGPGPDGRPKSQNVDDAYGGI